MNPNEMGSDDAAKAERIAAIVQRETLRHRRLIRLNGLFLLVPLAIGGLLLFWGRTDRQVVRDEAQRQVAPVETAYRAIRPALSMALALDTVLPGMRDAAQRLDQQAAQLASLMARQNALRAQVQSVGPTVARYGAALTRLQASQESLPQLRAAIQTMTNQQTVLRDSLRAALQASRKLVGQLGARLPRQEHPTGDQSNATARTNMTLQHVDTAIGFATLMLLLSLLITVLVQTTAAVLRLRGSNLFHGVVRLLNQADPGLAGHSSALAELVLRHPAVSHTAEQRATAISLDELIGVLEDVASRTEGGDAITALKGSLDSKTKQVKDKIKTWFETVMNRTTERFTLHTRWWTAGIALVLAAGLQIDSLSILKRLSTDSELRANLVASSQATLRMADSVTALNAKPAPVPGATRAAADTQIAKFRAAQDSITNRLNQTGFAFVPDPYPGLGAYRSPRHIVGTLMTMLFLSLGGPFWFHVLRGLANLRPSLAGKVEKEGAES